jgi:hypothetical protein
MGNEAPTFVEITKSNATRRHAERAAWGLFRPTLIQPDRRLPGLPVDYG